MLIVLRLLILLPIFVVILALVAWLITGNPRYRRFALTLLKCIVAAALLFFGLLVFDRIMQLWGG